MLSLSGAVDVSFEFPATPDTTMSFFHGLERIVEYLPMIELVQVMGQDEYRMVYSATEMGAYHIRIFADVKTELRRAERRLLILPTRNYPPVAKRSTFNGSTGQGFYASESLFTPAGSSATQIDYHLELKGQLPRPKGLRFMPSSVVSGIANNIADKRMQEIADGFIKNAMAAFPSWLDTYRRQHAL